MILLNFAHPLTDEHMSHIEQLVGVPLDRCISLPTHIDPAQPIVAQVVALVDRCDLSVDEWQTADIIVNPPGLAPLAVAICAEIHGRRGSFPSMLRLRAGATGLTTRYEVAEIINVQAIREAARTRRWSNPS
ncbi:MAG: CRISPR-associated protein Csx15 [Burkholderiaceae bacterium]